MKESLPSMQVFDLHSSYMPKKYAIAIVPIFGVLVCIAAIASIVEDSFKMRAGTYKQAE